jgi:hypothetical protein
VSCIEVGYIALQLVCIGRRADRASPLYGDEEGDAVRGAGVAGEAAGSAPGGAGCTGLGGGTRRLEAARMRDGWIQLRGVLLEQARIEFSITGMLLCPM